MQIGLADQDPSENPRPEHLRQGTRTPKPVDRVDLTSGVQVTYETVSSVTNSIERDGRRGQPSSIRDPVCEEYQCRAAQEHRNRRRDTAEKSEVEKKTHWDNDPYVILQHALYRGNIGLRAIGVAGTINR